MFQTRELANLHLKVVHRAGLMRCRVIGCEQTFEHGRALRRHIDESHRGLNNFQCEQCTLSYTSHACLSNHYRSHHEEGVFTCSQLDCQFTAPLRVEVHRHTRSGHRNTSKPFNTISTTTTTSSSLFIVPKRFSCPIEGCGLSFDSSSGLRQHGRTHSDVRPYLCVYPDCGGNTAFKVKSHAIRHIQEVHFQIPRLGRGRNAEMIEPNDNRDPMMYLQVINELLQ